MRLLGLSRDVEQVNSHKDDEETADKREGVDGRRSVESLKEDGGSDNGGRREEDVVDRVHPESL